MRTEKGPVARLRDFAYAVRRAVYAVDEVFSLAATLRAVVERIDTVERRLDALERRPRP